MANRFFSPDQQFVDSAGAPYAGGLLYFYASGTSTPLDTYSDSSLAIPNTNPVVLDSAGAAGDVFLQDLTYKVVLQDSNAVQVWTADPVYSSDYSTIAQFQSGAGSPNGSVAGTAGSPGIPASAYWDTTNNILYVCTTTGTAVTAVWTAVNASSAAAIVPAPQGRLTPTSGTAVISSEVVAATAIYYTPYIGVLVPVYNGSSFVAITFSELTLTLTSSQSANTLYDVFVFNNSGVPTLVTGPSWATTTAGSSARGTGAGTTQLARLSGIWVNAAQITGRNSSSTYTISANQATYLGSIYIDATAGQVTCHLTWGRNRKWGVYNAYNRTPVTLKVGDSTASWTYATNAYRAANNVPSSWTSAAYNVGSGTACNGLTTLDGLAEETVTQNYIIQASSTASGRHVNVGVGVNSITAVTGTAGAIAAFAGADITAVAEARNINSPTLGLTTVTAIENSPDAATIGFTGTQTSMLLTAAWRA